MKKLSLHKKDSLETRVSRYLFTYRITPHTVTGISPAEMLMGRRLRSALDLIKPDIGRKFEESRESMMLKRKTMLRKFEIGQEVWVRNYRDMENSKWLLGVITEVTGPVSYRVNVNGVVLRKHVDQLRTRVSDDDYSEIENEQEPSLITPDEPVPPSASPSDLPLPVSETPIVRTSQTFPEANSPEAEPPSPRPVRNRRPPRFYPEPEYGKEGQ